MSDGDKKPFSFTLGGTSLPLSETMDIIAIMLLIVSIYIPWSYAKNGGQTTATIYLNRIMPATGAAKTILDISGTEIGLDMIFVNLIIGAAIITGIILTGVNRTTKYTEIKPRLAQIFNALAGAGAITAVFVFNQLSLEAVKVALPSVTATSIELTNGVLTAVLAGILLIISAYIKNLSGKVALVVDAEEF